jgi:hypothetical protein
MINFNDVLDILQKIDNPRIQELREFVRGRNWCYGNWAPHVEELDGILSKLSNKELMEVAEKLLESGNPDIEKLVVWLISRSLEVGKLASQDRKLTAEDNEKYGGLRKRLGASECALDAIARWGEKWLKGMALEEIEKGKLKNDKKLKEKLNV